MKKVYVGMSGGVDSSVTAALLKRQGYDVTGVFMKNWAQDLPGFKCPWKEDLADAKRVAVQLNIPFKMYDFQKEYKQKVVDYMIDEYRAGRTPNPDIMCNQEVKFKLFLETALSDGADMIATGHYARILNDSGQCQLMSAVDTHKDQTYFLYRVTEDALTQTLFPLGDMKKSEVRAQAAKLGLITAEKKDSVGICFVGEIGIKEFLQNFVESSPGDIVDISTRQKVGDHDGALFYTIGQRHGLGVGGGLPYYVIEKDMNKNIVYVSSDLNDPKIWRSDLSLTSLHWINDLPKKDQPLFVRIRHRGPLISVNSFDISKEKMSVLLKDEVRAIAAGQSAVFYQNEICLGGGIIL